MKKIFNIFDDYLLHPNLKSGGMKQHKARMLLMLLFIILLIIVCLTLFKSYNHLTINLQLELVIYSIIFSFILFRVTGSLQLTSNLLIALLFAISINVILTSGAIFSELNSWVIVLPVIAFMYAEKVSAMLWFGIIVITQFLLYFYTSQDVVKHTEIKINDPFYFFALSVLLAIFLFFLAYVNNYTSNKIIGDLNKNQLNLVKAQQSLELTNENLENRVSQRTSELQDSQQRYRSIIDHLNAAILETDIYGNMHKIFDKDDLILSSHRVELNDLNIKQILPYKNVYIKELAQGKYVNFETQIIDGQGNPKWVLVSSSPLQSTESEITGLVHLVFDIDERKKMENDLIQAKESAEKAQKAEKMFLANMSHEIRTPLNAIIGMSFMMKDTAMDARQKDHIDVILSSAELLNGLLRDILDFSKIESGKMILQNEPFKPLSIFNGLKRTFEMKCEDKAIELDSSIDSKIDDITLLGDPIHLSQITMNLLSNAVKFTDIGKVTFHVESTEKDNAMWLRILVRDTGIGIKQKDLDKIFQPFKQSESQGKHSQGTGLGLAITTKLIELHHGDIDVKSELGKGTTFVVNIPFPIISEDESERLNKNINESFENHVTNSKRILVVEDNPMNQKYIKGVLRKWGGEYDIVENGQIACDYCKEREYYVIFMDLQMPVMDGFQATHHIRNEENLNMNTPIVALTAGAVMDIKEQALSSGMNDFLTKPYNPSQLNAFLPALTKEESPK